MTFFRTYKKIKYINVKVTKLYSRYSFIFFSYLFYGKVLGYIDDNTINNNLLPSNSKSLYDTILRSWKLLENSLKSKGINEIQIFLHLIYPKLIEIFKKFFFVLWKICKWFKLLILFHREI